MTESEFLLYTDQFFDHLENQVEEQKLDVDCLLSGNVFTIEYDDEQIVINRHVPNQELWIAAKSGGFHFTYVDGQWLSTRDHQQFFDVLNSILSTILGERVVIHPF